MVGSHWPEISMTSPDFEDDALDTPLPADDYLLILTLLLGEWDSPEDAAAYDGL
jgi:hypothetical protein